MKESAFFSKSLSKMSWRSVRKAVLFLFIFLLGIFVSMIAYGEGYRSKVLPGVRIGEIPIGGMTGKELSGYLMVVHEKLMNDGILIYFQIDSIRKETILTPQVILDDDIYELVHIDIAEEVKELIEYKGEYNMFRLAWEALMSRILQPKAELVSVEVDEAGLLEELHENFFKYETKPESAGVEIKSLYSFEYTITSSTPGSSFIYNDIGVEVKEAWSKLHGPEIEIELVEQEPDFIEEDVTKISHRLSHIFDKSGIQLNYIDPHSKRKRSWSIEIMDISEWIEPSRPKDGQVSFGLNYASTTEFIKNKIASQVEREAQDAKFSVGETGRVLEFQGSRPGVELDIEETYEAINNVMHQRTWHDEGVPSAVTVSIKQLEPKIKTGEINDLGIEEILGVGHSNYSGSPANRIKNIRHAVKNKLNGILIKPEEKFSLLNALKPFTEEAGYLPELVIKGDRIKPEIGGGLCQIGSTMFRAAMNTGVPILDRRNHSIVVSYYNDMRNGNPGTDATIYDPAPDLKFLNDTGHYLLLTTEMDEQTGDLFFTLWGTSDGRKGYYTEPEVSRWIPHGEDQVIETEELEPGEEKCQSAHNGAVAAFTYIRKMPDGEEEEQVFESYYRPLPKICLIGIEEKEEEHVFDPADDLIWPRPDIKEKEDDEENDNSE